MTMGHGTLGRCYKLFILFFNKVLTLRTFKVPMVLLGIVYYIYIINNLYNVV